MASRSLVAVAALCLGSTGCSFIAGEHDAETRFLLKPRSDASFFGWSEITISEDVNQVDGATLQFVTLEVMEPPDTPDLRFIDFLRGEAVTPEERTLVVEQTDFPQGEPSVSLDIKHTGDLRGFFPDGHTIRVEWTGQTDPTYPSWPAEGFWIRVALRVVVE
jgi:hypothetical protein